MAVTFEITNDAGPPRTLHISVTERGRRSTALGQVSPGDTRAFVVDVRPGVRYSLGASSDVAYAPNQYEAGRTEWFRVEADTERVVWRVSTRYVAVTGEQENINN